MLAKLFLLFMKLSFLSIGGGYPMMALILQEGQAAVGLTATEFADMAALELLASGPIALNAATYIGYIKAGFSGALVATAGVCVAPIVLTTILYYFLQKFQHNRYMQAFIKAIVAGSAGLLLATAVTLGRNIFFHDATLAEVMQQPGTLISWSGLVIMAGCLIAGLRFRMNPIALVLGSGVLGVVLSFFLVTL